ncbi:MAG: hypothetical protein RIS24_2639, partial [Verrucomicrobiota bacterium]
MNRFTSTDGSAPDMDRVPGLRWSRRRFGAWAI